MANEITATVTVQCINGSFKALFAPGAKQITQTTLGGHSTIWNVGTSEEDMPVGDVATNGVLCLLNTDATNYVQIGPKVGGVMEECIRLKPGVPQFFQCEPGITWTGKANTAACKVQMLLLEL